MKQIPYISGQGMSVVPFVVCSLTGEILRIGSAPIDAILQQASDGELAMIGAADQMTQYVDLTTGVVIDKTSIVPVVNGLVLSGLPDPCTVSAEGESAEILGGSITLEFDVPGTYYVTIEALHRLPATVMVTQP